MTFIKKSYCIVGNTKDNNLCYFPYPANEFSSDFTHLCISSISAQLKQEEAVSEVCVLSCNYVTSQAYFTGQVKLYQIPLLQFELNLTNKKKKVYQFDKCWFPINCVSEFLQFSVKNLESQLITVNCKVSVLVHFI